MFNKLKEIIQKNLNYLGREIGELSANETFLSVKTELVLSVILLIQIILVYLIWGDLAGKVSNFSTLRENKISAEKRLGQIESNLLQIKNSPQAAKSLLETLPGSKDNYSLLEKLNSAAGANQVSLLSVNFLPTKNSSLDGLSEQPVEIRVGGNYENIFSFTSDLEKSKRPILTESIEYTTNNKTLTSGIVEVNIVIKTFLVGTNQ